MNTLSSLLNPFFAAPPLISTSRPTAIAFPIPRIFPELSRFSSKRIRYVCNSGINLNSRPNFNASNHEFSVSFLDAQQETNSQVATADKLRLLVSEFRSLTEPIDRVKRLLNYAAALAPLDESARVLTNRVTGCTTQVWLEIRMDESGRMRFRADSDSEISKGFCSCLIWILDGAKPEEVMGVRSEDLTEMNVGVHGKAQSRVNTWHNVLMSMQKRTMALVDADVADQEADRPAPHDLLLLAADFNYLNGSYMETKVPDYSVSLLPLYHDFTI